MQKTVYDIPEMYSEMMILMKMEGVLEKSRNGDVLSLPSPITVSVQKPNHRVLVDPIRNANPFFHLMEFVWMMAGENKVRWLAQFNKKMYEYADEDNEIDIAPHIHGAYGNRWQHYFGTNQIIRAIQMLREDPTSRRVVLTMWDPTTDLGANKKDIPCNTHIYLRMVKDALDMTVCNRSNDVIWGMTGANAVHMTLLHEFIASAIGKPLGWYRVFTNNAHIYLGLPRVQEMLETRYPTWPTQGPGSLHPLPVLGIAENPDTFIMECMAFLNNQTEFECSWLERVALPAKQLWFDRTSDNCIGDFAWRAACDDWLQRKVKGVK